MLPGLALAVALLATPVGASSTTASGPELRPLAYVSAEDDDRLAVVDLRSRRVLRRIPVADGPHNVAASWDGRFVLVTSPPAGRVTLVSGRSLRVLKVFSGLGYPHDVELGGRHAYVTDERRDEIVVIDLVARRVVARVNVAPGPHDLAVSDAITVTHSPRASRLTLLDAATPSRPRFVGRLRAGRGAPHDIVPRPDTPNVFLTYWNSGVVSELDAGTGRLGFRRRVGSLVHHIAFDYYAVEHLWATDHGDGRILLLSARTGRRIRSVSRCPGAHHVAIVAARRAAVACHDSGRLVVVAASGRRVASIRVGDGLHGVAVARVVR